MNFTPDEINTVVKNEVSGINEAFKKNERVAIVLLLSAIYDFRKLLVQKQGEFINGMNMDYRHFTTALLQGIDAEHTEVATKEVLVPSYSSDEIDVIIENLSKIDNEH